MVAQVSRLLPPLANIYCTIIYLVAQQYIRIYFMWLSILSPVSSKESINLRLGAELKAAVEQASEHLLGDTRPTDLSTTAQKLILVGLGARQAGIEPEIRGPLGVLSRPFARASFDGETVTMGTQLDAKTIDQLKEAFVEKKHTAARRALRLGVIMMQADQLDIEGPLGGPRPFAEIHVPDRINRSDASTALRELQEALES